MYYPAGQKFTQNRSISYSFRNIKTFSFSAKIKVAITPLAMDLQVSKFAITQYIKLYMNNIFDKNPVNLIVLLL